MKKIEEEKVILISIANIIPNQEYQKTIKEEVIQILAESVKEKGQQTPIDVRALKNNQFEIIDGHARLKAVKFLNQRDKSNWRKIKAIIHEISEDEAYEKALIQNLCRTNISSIDRETQLTIRYFKGKDKSRYENPTDFAKKLGLSAHHIADNISGYKDRKEIFGTEVTSSEHVSTETLRIIKTLKIEEKRKFCDRIKDKKIKPRDGREAVNFLKSKSVSDEIKEAILNGDTNWRDAKDIIEKRLPLLKELEKAIGLYHKKETIQKIVEDEKPKFSAEPFRLLSDFKMAIEPIYIDKINSETEKKQAILYYKIDGVKTFRDLYKLGKIDFKQYHTICKIAGIEPEIIEQLKDDGHYYFFPDEWLKPTEKKLKEKLDKLLTGENEPLLNL
ncbi:MAG: ParB/RepB/Spo0J family partition protein [Thermoplasmatales archaeon]|nr:ParB/RepB/Spo0J family partition protein [Thermoplasmatales archaeon]